MEEHLLHITMSKIDNQLCYDILSYLDDVDLCGIINSKYSVQLLEIYWQLYQYHISYDYASNTFKKLRLLFSSHWTDSKLISIKDRINKNGAHFSDYLADYYIPTMNDSKLIKPKLLYADGHIFGNYEPYKRTDEYHFDYINEELNEGFGNKVIRLLRIIIDNEESQNYKIEFERLKHKKYAKKSNDVIANGIFYIWHCHSLKRSFALEQQSFSSFIDAMSEEYGGDEYGENNKKSLHNVSIEYKEELTPKEMNQHRLSVNNHNNHHNVAEVDYTGYDVNLRQSLCRVPATPLTPMGGQWQKDMDASNEMSTFKFQDEQTTVRLSFNTDSPTDEEDEVAF